ncbi:hypothetical protein [Shewanella chilikensis]|uniref:hypothetical protein n=1 Tax=Shewanella chilikensis TaxID=558541 RepID=UPI00399BE516
MNHDLETLIVEAAANFDMPEPAAVTPSKQRLISPELIAQKFDEKRQANERMKIWLESCRNNTKF